MTLYLSGLSFIFLKDKILLNGCKNPVFIYFLENLQDMLKKLQLNKNSNTYKKVEKKKLAFKSIKKVIKLYYKQFFVLIKY